MAHLHCQSFTSLLRSCSMSLCVSSSVAVLTFVVGPFSFETIKVQTKLLFFFRGFIQDNATYYPSKECRRHGEIIFKNAIYRCFFTNFIYIFSLFCSFLRSEIDISSESVTYFHRVWFQNWIWKDTMIPQIYLFHKHTCVNILL